MITRTYETFAVNWAGGSRWSSYGTAAGAQAVIDGSGRAGDVERGTFSVTFDDASAHLYNPGICETTWADDVKNGVHCTTDGRYDILEADEDSYLLRENKGDAGSPDWQPAGTYVTLDAARSGAS